MGWRVGARRLFLCQCWRRGWRGHGGVASPHQHGAVLVHGYPLDLNEFGLQVLKVRIV